jgi:hypothetical protein
MKNTNKIEQNIQNPDNAILFFYCKMLKKNTKHVHNVDGNNILNKYYVCKKHINTFTSLQYFKICKWGRIIIVFKFYLHSSKIYLP